MTRLCIVGEYNPDFPPHAATNAAIEHSCRYLGIEVSYEWASTESMVSSNLKQFSGFWIAPGSPYKSMEGALRVIQYARELNIPCLGTCGGFQHMVIEYARNVLGYKDATHAEYDPYASNLFISSLACSLAGCEMELEFAEGSSVAKIYGKTKAKENYYCNFGVSDEAVPLLRDGPLKVVGSDSEGDVRVLELPGHPYFVATLFVPQNRSQPDNPHPLINAFLGAMSKTATVNAPSTKRFAP